MTTAKKVYIETVGCQMNVLDSELVIGALKRQGYVLTDTAADADVVLFNTCSVREHAEEKVYSNLGRAAVKGGADFLVNLSNEAWFPDSAEFDQATAMSVFRAAEIRRTVVRCANSGTSGSIDPWGRKSLLERDGRRDGFAGTVVVAPPIHGAITPYVRFGEWVGAASALATLALLLIPRRRASSAAP